MTSTITDKPVFSITYDIYQGDEWVASSDDIDDALHYFYMYKEENLGRVRMYKTLSFRKDATP